MEPIIEFKNYSFKYNSQVEPTLRDIDLSVYPGEKILIIGPSGSGKSTLANCINGLVPFSYAGESTGELYIGGKEPKDLGIFGLSKMVGTVLQDTDGQFIGLIGHTGSGKSTLIKLLLKELEPTEGTITINGRNLHKIRRKQIPRYRRNVGVVFQDFRLLKDRNVYENVAFAQRVIGASNRKIKSSVPTMLSMVGLAAKYKSLPKQLSGGEQQRVAIARALVNEPKILLADEPTGNLDNNNAWEIMRLLEEINKRGTTVLVVTHNLEFVKKMNKRVIKIDKGVLVYDKLPGEGNYEN